MIEPDKHVRPLRLTAPTIAFVQPDRFELRPAYVVRA